MEYPWFEDYRVIGMPHTLEPYPDEPSHFLLDRAVTKYPRLQFVQSGLEIPYLEVQEHSMRLANALAALGVKKGDRVATLLPTSIQYVVADTSISRAGAVHVPCSFLESRESLARKSEESSSKALICLDEHLAQAEYLRDNTDVKDIIVTSLDDYSGKLPGGPERPGTHRLLTLIEQARAEPPSVSFDSARDLEAIIFTGGTTGMAKGCMLTHRNVIANAMQNPTVFGPYTEVFEGLMSVLMGNPFYHSYGHSVMHTMLYSCFNLLLITDPRDYKSMLKMVKTYCPVLQFGVPTQFMKILEEDPGGAGVIGISGSAPLPPKVQDGFKESGEGYLLEGYGLSELTAVSHFNATANIRVMGGRKMTRLMNVLAFNRIGIALLRALGRALGPRRFGKSFMWLASLLAKRSKFSRKLRKVEKYATIGIPLPDTEVRVVDAESGKPYSFEELSREDHKGEMLLRGPQTMLGYWPEEGSGLDAEGYVHTGDVVKMDSRGYFSIVDRIKDMVIVSGYKVYTRELDDILYEHPATEIAASIGVPDPERPGSERIQAFIQLKDEHKGKVSEQDYIDFLEEKVARYAVPRKVVFLEEMPLTGVFKVNKKTLRDIASGE